MVDYIVPLLVALPLLFMIVKQQIKIKQMESDRKVLGRKYDSLLTKTTAVQEIYDQSANLSRDELLDSLYKSGAVRGSGSRL
ncbi:MAG: hypothetical protein ACRCXK_04515 [Wohlfahrtiimonas sp.]